MASGRVIVLTGPSGVGKGTLVRALLERHRDLYLSISATTRSPRPGERDGKDYFFVSRSQFEEMIQSGQLLEWAEYTGNYYGTPREGIESHIAQGKVVLLEIEVMGARSIKQTMPDAISIFIAPPSPSELERRLRGRGQDSAAAIARRLAQATQELAARVEFDCQIVNDDFDKALAELESALGL